MTEIDWAALEPLAEKIAYEIAAKWTIVEPDDVKQEILLHAVKEQPVIAAYQGNEEVMRKIFYTAGRRYAARERAYLDLMDDQYHYTPDERSEEHTSELQSHVNLVCRLLLEK